jgi:hypothetical protein
VLEQEKRVRNLTSLALADEFLLQAESFGVINQAELVNAAKHESTAYRIQVGRCSAGL